MSNPVAQASYKNVPTSKRLGSTYYEKPSGIKVGHPLYDISLIDPKNEDWAKYLEMKANNKDQYKNNKLGNYSDLPETPKVVSKSLRIREKVDPGFKDSREGTIFSAVAKRNFEPKSE